MRVFFSPLIKHTSNKVEIISLYQLDLTNEHMCYLSKKKIQAMSLNSRGGFFNKYVRMRVKMLQVSSCLRDRGLVRRYFKRVNHLLIRNHIFQI